MKRTFFRIGCASAVVAVITLNIVLINKNKHPVQMAWNESAKQTAIKYRMTKDNPITGMMRRVESFYYSPRMGSVYVSVTYKGTNISCNGVMEPEVFACVERRMLKIDVIEDGNEDSQI